MKSFTLRMSGPERRDCTAPYSVTLHKENYTVKEFIEDVLAERPNEWGNIKIRRKESNFFKFPSCQYSHGKLTSSPLSEEYLNREINFITADGGWSNMDYLITLNPKPVTIYKIKKHKIVLKPLDN